MRIDPDNALAYMNRAIVQETLKQRDGAIADYGEVIRLAPTNAAAWSGRCWSRAIIGELEPALADCNEALRLESSAGTLERRALVHLKSGQLDKAIADYDAASRRTRGLPARSTDAASRGFAKAKPSAGNADIAAAKEINPRIVDMFAGYNVPPQRAQATAARGAADEPRATRGRGGAGGEPGERGRRAGGAACDRDHHQRRPAPASGPPRRRRSPVPPLQRPRRRPGGLRAGGDALEERRGDRHAGGLPGPPRPVSRLPVRDFAATRIEALKK